MGAPASFSFRPGAGVQAAQPAPPRVTPAPAVRHSAYLADALHNIAQTGGANIRTKGALASNLLAEAILAFAAKKADQQRPQPTQQGDAAATAPPSADPSAPLDPRTAAILGDALKPSASGPDLPSSAQPGPPPQQPPFAQSIPSSGPQSAASGAQPPPTPRPLQVVTGPGPSTPSPAAMGPQGASPFAVVQSPATADVPPALAQGAPAGPPPGAPLPAAPGGGGGGPPGPGGAGGGPINPQPAPIQPHQLERLQQLRAQAAQHPQVFGPVLMDYAAELRRQQSTPEQLVLSRPNASGHAAITGRISGRLYGLRTPDGSILAVDRQSPPAPQDPAPIPGPPPRRREGGDLNAGWTK